MAENPLLELINVNKTFKLHKRAKSELTVLHDIDLKVEAGEFSAVIGPSGAGKSTLLYIIGALDRPSSGEVLFQGRNLSELTDRALAELRLKHIGFIFQNYNLIPTLTALENIAITQIMGTGKGPGARSASEMLELVGLSERSDHLPYQLSGGEQQRLAVARALYASPKVLLADEPTGNLDTKSGIEIIELFKKLNKSLGTAVIMVTHNSKMAEYAHRKLRMIDGRIK